MANKLTHDDYEQEPLHPAFYRFAQICRRIEFAVIEELRIQDGLPVFVDVENKDKQVPLHRALYRFAEICRRIEFGVIERLCIHHGVPVFVEIELRTALAANVKQKHNLTSPK